jgi:hypothetical protein
LLRAVHRKIFVSCGFGRLSKNLFILLDTTSELLYFSSALGLLLFARAAFYSFTSRFQTRHLLADRFQLSAVTAGFSNITTGSTGFRGKYSEFWRERMAYFGHA